MTKLVLAICGERYEQGWHVRRFAYIGLGDGNEKPKDSQYVMKMLRRLVDAKDIDPTTGWTAGQEPPADYARFFDVYVMLENQGKENAFYKADYHAYPHCPAAAVDDGMEIYREIRRTGIRPAVKKQEMMRKIREQQREAREAEETASREAGRLRAEAEAKLPRFEAGKMYFYPYKDSLGHLAMGCVQVTALMPKDGRMMVDVSGGRKRVVVEVRRDADGEFATLRKQGITIRANCKIA